MKLFGRFILDLLRGFDGLFYVNQLCMDTMNEKFD